MAGTSASFDAAAFRARIRAVMEMAAPGGGRDGRLVRAAFGWDPTPVGGVSAGPDGVPFDPAAAEAVVVREEVVVPCAVEYRDAADADTGLGFFSPSQVVVTLLDADHAQVAGCHWVRIDADRYDYRSTDPPVALFDVVVHQMRFTTAQET